MIWTMNLEKNLPAWVAKRKRQRSKRKKRQEGIKPEFKIYDSDRLKQGGKEKKKKKEK